MFNYLIVEFSDGKRFAIPAEVIAKDRARYYAELDSAHGHGEYEEIYGMEFEYTMGDAFELEDWAANNMNWPDVEEHAALLPPEEKDYDEEWTNAKMEVKS